MKIELEQLFDWIDQGIVQPDAGWGDARETACLMSALTGETSIEGCAAQGWPEWLAEMGTYIFDNAGDEWIARSVAFAEAVAAAEARGADLSVDGEVFCRIRMDAVLPIALESVGEGGEPWRAACRQAVQDAIDSGGKRNLEAANVANVANAADAAWSAEAAGAARAAGAAWAARAAGAAWAAGSARAVEAAGDAGAAAWTRIYEATIAALRGDVQEGK